MHQASDLVFFNDLLPLALLDDVASWIARRQNRVDTDTVAMRLKGSRSERRRSLTLQSPGVGMNVRASAVRERR